MRLSEEEINKRINELSNWKFIDNNLTKDFQLKNFSDAVSFIVKIAIEAEKLDHHPDILLYGWNKVKIKLSTHDINGISEKDFELAHKIDQL